MRSICVLGASGHGKVIAEMAISNAFHSIIFYDDAWPGKKSIGFWPVVGNTQSLIQRANDRHSLFIVAIGNNRIRIHKLRQLQDAGLEAVSLCHPMACISPSARMGSGVVAMAGAIVNADTQVGDGVILNTGATVDHDCVIEPGAHISPGVHLAGNVEIGSRTWIGIGAVVRQGICIGPDVLVGAGAVVVNDIPAGQIVAGVPARAL